MKLREKIKRFWTLDVHNHQGFTLVELIIVIAILAILSSVAVVGYSSYVTKANKQADITLAGEVANALMLYYYSNSGAGTGYVVLTQDGSASYADEVGTAAMNAAFGVGWEETLSLSWNGWTLDGGTLSSVAISQIFEADVIATSPYMTGTTPEALLENVQVLTGAATELFEGVDAARKYELIRGQLFASDEELQALCEQFGITIGKDANDKPVFENVTDEQLSNLLVFGVASQVGNSVNEDDPTAVTQLAKRYANYTAFVNTSPNNQNETILAAYEAMNSALNNAKNAAAVESAFTTFETSCGSAWTSYSNDTDTQKDNLTAFKGVMQAVNQVATNVTAADIANGDYFTSDAISSQFNTYISAVDLMAQMFNDNDTEMLNDVMNNHAIVIFLWPNALIDASNGEVLPQ